MYLQLKYKYMYLIWHVQSRCHVFAGMSRVCYNATCLPECHVSVKMSRVCYDATCLLR